MNFQRMLIDQFHNPHGFMGFIAGQIMSKRQSNVDRNRWTLDLLGLEPGDRVLELGPGPGTTLELILDRVPDGFVVGVDHSNTMLSQCRRKNRTAYENNRLSLVEGEFTDLPELPGLFNRILAVNSIQFDGMTSETFAQITRYLAVNGVFAITFQPRGKNPTDEKALAFAEKLVGLLQDAGLSHARIEKLPLEPACAVCVLATK